MSSCNDFFVMKHFPDFHRPSFDIEEYNKTFEKKNVIINASSKNVSFAEHWGPLSVKCAIKGNEHYESNSRFYTVTENNYLIFNNGEYYSSFIHSDIETESFTINFSSGFQQCVFQSFQNNLDDSQQRNDFEFIEKLYQHNNLVSPLLFKLYRVSAQKKPDTYCITEIYYSLLEKLFLQQFDLRREIQKIDAAKYSTQLELYKRLNFARDFIHSCYMDELGLDKLASVACLNTAYFLRTFKKSFGLTPYQYIIKQRLEAAQKMLETTSCSITEICFAVGYRDVTSFTKLFKKNFNTTPEKYQSAHMKKSFFTC